MSLDEKLRIEGLKLTAAKAAFDIIKTYANQAHGDSVLQDEECQEFLEAVLEMLSE